MSYINTAHRFVYVHVPRTGGTSMLSLPAMRMADEGHRTYRELVQDPDFDDAFFSFAFVRNPFERLVSAYFHVVECHRFDRYASFDSFVRQDFRGRDGYAAANSTLLRRGHRHFMPMADLLVAPDGSIGPAFVGRHERLADDWRRVHATIGSAATLPHLNASGSGGGIRHGDWRGHYTRELVDIVVDVYGKDFELFDYPPVV
jgi:hypothetical protein